MALSEPCASCVLYLEHQMLREAFGEWAGFDREHAAEDIAYLGGVNDFAQRAIESIEDRMGEGDEE